MNEEDLDKYIELNAKFVEACENYCRVMNDYDSDYGEIDTFTVCDWTVEGTGHNYHYDEDFSVEFPVEHLLMSDEELSAYVAKLISEKRKKQEEEQGRLENEERALYEKLKAKYESNRD